MENIFAFLPHSLPISIFCVHIFSFELSQFIHAGLLLACLTFCTLRWITPVLWGGCPWTSTRSSRSLSTQESFLQDSAIRSLNKPTPTLLDVAYFSQDLKPHKSHCCCSKGCPCPLRYPPVVACLQVAGPAEHLPSPVHQSHASKNYLINIKISKNMLQKSTGSVVPSHTPLPAGWLKSLASTRVCD